MFMYSKAYYILYGTVKEEEKKYKKGLIGGR